MIQHAYENNHHWHFSILTHKTCVCVGYLSHVRQVGLRCWLHCWYYTYSKWNVRDSPCALSSHDETQRAAIQPRMAQQENQIEPKSQIEHQLPKIKFIWNLQIYDFNNPFDRTALVIHIQIFFLCSIFFSSFFSCVIRVPSNKNGPIKPHFRSNACCKCDAMMVLIFTCCFCIAANNEEKEKNRTHRMRDRMRVWFTVRK